MNKKLLIGLAAVAVASIAAYALTSRESTLEERCAWKSINQTLRQYPGGMTEFESYTITHSQYYEAARIIIVRGDLDYTVNGMNVSVPFSKTCNIR